MIYIGVFPTMFFDPSMLTFVGMDSCHEQPSKIRSDKNQPPRR
jgi:hypothetical protein